MSKKCLVTVSLYALFLALMAGTAYIFSYLNFNHVIGKVVIIIALLLVSVTLALTVERGSFITIVVNALLWGTALSFLFDNLDIPDLIQTVYVVLAMVAWFALFCFLTNLSLIKENYKIAMLLWGAIFAIADIVFAVYMQDVLGWTALILLVPFIMFFISLPGEAEDFTEHTHHVAVYTTIPALILVRLILFFRVSAGSFEKGDFFPEVDEDYVFVYCPKYDDEENDIKEDSSEFM